jgi:hypothetical protein
MRRSMNAVARCRRRWKLCFASGFGLNDGQDANLRLLKRATGDMPILGPNCYGMIQRLRWCFALAGSAWVRSC